MSDRIPDREITPREVYFNRRTFLRAGLLAATAAGTALLYRRLNRVGPGHDRDAGDHRAGHRAARPTASGSTKPLTPRAVDSQLQQLLRVLDRQGRRRRRGGEASRRRAGQVEVGGLVHKPRVFDLDDLRRLSPPEERVYRMRCVEAWSMVIPWAGYSLSKLLAAVEPTADAKYVAFETLLDPARMPNQKHGRARRGRTSKGCGWTRRCIR